MNDAIPGVAANRRTAPATPVRASGALVAASLHRADLSAALRRLTAVAGDVVNRAIEARRVMHEDGHTGATVRLTREDAYRFRVLCGMNGTARIITDEPPPLGGGAGPNPTELLAAAVGNCLASSLLFCMQKAHLEVEEFEVEVSTTMVRDTAGRLRIGAMQVGLAPTVSPGVREKMGRCQELFENFCTVTQSIRRGIEVTVAVEPRVSEAATHDGILVGPPCAPIAGR